MKSWIKQKEVWVLLIENGHGSNISVHCTEEAAMQSLFEYCANEWDDGVEDQCGPLDALRQDEAIEAYFDTWGNGFNPEWYTLKKVNTEG